MNLHYRLGWPMARFLGRCGVPIHIRVDVIHDEEADVFVGMSPDLRGLVVESDTLEGVVSEAKLLLPDLLMESDRCARSVTTDLRYRERVAHA